MSGFLLMRDVASTSDNKNETIINTDLLKKILNSEVSLKTTTSDVLLSKIAENISKLESNATAIVDTYATVNAAYERWLEYKQARADFTKRSAWFNAGFNAILWIMGKDKVGNAQATVATSVTLLVAALLTGSYLFFLIYAIIFAAMYPLLIKFAMDNDEVIQHLLGILAKNVPEVSSPGPMPMSEIVDISARIAEYEQFAERLIDDESSSIPVSGIVDMIMSNVNDENQEDFYTLLLTNKNYFLSIIYLLKYGFINSNDISKFVAMSLEEDRTAYIIKMLKTERYDVLIPFMNSIASLTSVNIKNELNSSSEIEECVSNVVSLVENSESNLLGNNVIVGASKYNPTSIFADYEISPEDYSVKSHISEFSYYDEFTANDLTEAPNYLDNTNMIGYIINGLVNEKQLQLNPDKVDKIKISDKGQNVSAYDLITQMLNEQYKRQIDEKFNRRNYITNTKINAAKISDDLKQTLRNITDNKESYTPYLKLVVNEIYGDAAEDSFDPKNKSYLNFINFSGKSVLTESAKNIVKKIIQTDFIGDDTLTSPQIMGSWLVNQDLESTSGISNYFTNDIRDILKSNMSIVNAADIGSYNSFMITDSEKDNNFPAVNSDISKDNSNAYKIDTLGSFIDIKSSLKSITNVLDVVSPWIDYEGNPEAIVSSYNYYISEYLLNKDKSVIDVDSMPINQIITLTLFYDILSSYWYYLKYGETLFERISGDVVVKDTDKLYSRYQENTFVYFRDKRLDWNDVIAYDDSHAIIDPVTGQRLTHRELKTVYFKLSADQIYYGHKIYYDEPKLVEHVRKTIVTEHKITTVIVHIVAKVVEVVAKVINWLFGWIPAVKKKMETVIEKMEEIQEKTITSTHIEESVNNYNWEQIDNFIESYAGDDKYSPYVWENLILMDHETNKNLDVGPTPAQYRTMNAQEDMESRANNADYDNGDGSQIQFTPLVRIHWYSPGPRVYVDYKDYLEDGGLPLDGEDRTNYDLRFEAKDRNALGYAWIGDQIQNRVVYESERSFIPTADTNATYINQITSDIEGKNPIKSAISITGDVTTQIKDYYLYHSERVWKYHQRRIAYNGESVRYYEAGSDKGKYGKSFTMTSDTNAIYEFSSSGRSAKVYYRKIPIDSFLAGESKSNSDRSEFILGRDFFVGNNVSLSSSVNLNILDSKRELYRKLIILCGLNFAIYVPITITPGEPLPIGYKKRASGTKNVFTRLKYLLSTFEEKFDFVLYDYIEILYTYEPDSNGDYILDENNKYITYKKTIDSSIRLDNTSALKRCNKFARKEVEIPVNCVGEAIRGFSASSTTNTTPNCYKKAIDDDKFHPVISGEFYKFYQLLYYLRHCILDLPEYVNAIKTTKQWEEFELALNISNINKLRDRPWN